MSVLKYIKVLIPLNSGLVFTCYPWLNSIKKTCLNPFEFRAGIYFDMDGTVVCSLRLNPFEFRAGIYFHLESTCKFYFCLNPFEFRAGIYLPRLMTSSCRYWS